MQLETFHRIESDEAELNRRLKNKENIEMSTNEQAKNTEKFRLKLQKLEARKNSNAPLIEGVK